MTSSSSERVKLCAVAGSQSLVTRDQGASLRAEILDILRRLPRVVVDLNNVHALSPSFADELFAGLESELGGDFKDRIQIDCPRPEWKRLITSALARRRGSAA